MRRLGSWPRPQRVFDEACWGIYRVVQGAPHRRIPKPSNPSDFRLPAAGSHLCLSCFVFFSPGDPNRHIGVLLS